MSRTNKKWARVMKAQQEKLAKIRSTRVKEYTKVTSIEQGMQLGLLQKKINPIGVSYHWFVYGRKNCYETGIKLDRDGYRYNKQFDLYQKIMPTGWQRNKLKR